MRKSWLKTISNLLQRKAIVKSFNDNEKSERYEGKLSITLVYHDHFVNFLKKIQINMFTIIYKGT